ncbi:MAG: hypothetical protein CMH30_03175 [Micavibrio sp.]|nr:hypothetical protein [Micavibrio sp.]|tara:strand:- start:241 stop:621 length:381 start_codon:yes stop_codon:yes gene_type:complete
MNDNNLETPAVRKTVIFPKYLWEKVVSFNESFMFSSDVAAARFLLCFGLRTNPIKLAKRYPEQDERIYLNLSNEICEEVSNFRFGNRLHAEREAIFMLIEQGLENVQTALKQFETSAQEEKIAVNE